MHQPANSSGSISQQLSRFSRLRHSRSFRDSTGTLVIEGIRQFIQAFDAAFEFDTIISSPILLRHSLAQKCVRRLGAIPRRTVVTPEQYRSISTTERASGIAAMVRQRWTPLSQVSAPAGLGFLLIDQIRSPGNLGTILRTAEAVGMGGVCFIGDEVDPFDPTVIRASMGGIFHLPLVRTRPRELGLWLAQNRVQTLGLSPHASTLWTNAPVAASYAIALGEERQGISSPLRRLCDVEVRLPMTGRADSLNVAVAAGIMMYELARRRG